MVTKWVFLNRKLAVALARLCGKNGARQNFVANTFFQGGTIKFGTMTTFLALETKFWDSASKSEIIDKTATILFKVV